MKRRTIIQVLIAGAITLGACQKNTDIFVPDTGQLNGPDTAWYSAITPSMPVSSLKNSIVIQPYQDTININSNIATINAPSGLQVNFPPHCCINAAGQPVLGTVNVELRAIKTKGDMIKLNKPTTSFNRLLVSAGELFVSLKQNGQPLHLAPGIRYNIRYTEGIPNSLMKFFVGDDSNIERFNWLVNPDQVNNSLIPGTQAYEINTNRLGWMNTAYFYDTNNIARVMVNAELAPYFTNANTVAFTVFKDFRSVAGMYGDMNTKKFSTGKIPGGKAITVVVISKQANDYYLGFESAVTIISTVGNPTQNVLVKPIKKSLPEILNYLSTL